jgi:hypothetical protein
MTQTFVEEAIWQQLPEREWITHDQVRDIIRDVTVGAVTFKGSTDADLDGLIGALVDQGYVTWRNQYGSKPMSSSERQAWEKHYMEVHGKGAAAPLERCWVVFLYQRRPANEVPILQSRDEAVKQVRDAIQQHNDQEDAKLLAAAKRLGFVRGTSAEDTLPTATTQEARNGR